MIKKKKYDCFTTLKLFFKALKSLFLWITNVKGNEKWEESNIYLVYSNLNFLEH